MAKTYGTVTTFTAGSVLTAAQLNVAGGAVNNLVLPASCQLVRTTNLTSYTASSDITWSSAAWDTDSMFSAGSPTQITVNTTGLFVITGMIQMSATATVTTANVDILKNAALVSRMILPINSTSTGGYANPSYVASCVAGDIFTFRIGITGGSAYIITGNATETNNQSRISMTWIGRTS